MSDLCGQNTFTYSHSFRIKQKKKHKTSVGLFYFSSIPIQRHAPVLYFVRFGLVAIVVIVVCFPTFSFHLISLPNATEVIAEAALTVHMYVSVYECCFVVAPLVVGSGITTFQS